MQLFNRTNNKNRWRNDIRFNIQKILPILKISKYNKNDNIKGLDFMRKVIIFILLFCFTTLGVGCVYTSKSTSVKTVSEKSISITTQKDSYNENLNLEVNEGEEIYVDFKISLGKLNIRILSDDNTELYSGSDLSSDTNFTVGIKEPGIHLIEIKGSKLTGSINIEAK